MKKRISKMLTCMLVMISMLLFAIPAQAAETAEVQIPFSVTLTGTLPSSASTETHTIQLKASNATNPMPEGVTGDTATATVTGAASGTFPKMTFTEVGEYHYQVSELAGSVENETYDSTVYDVTVYVTNGATIYDRVATVVIRKGGDKPDGIVFTNTFPVITPTEPTESPTPTDTVTPSPTPTPTATAIPTATPTPGGGRNPIRPILTGDLASPWFWLEMAAICVVIVFFAIRMKKKK